MRVQPLSWVVVCNVWVELTLGESFVSFRRRNHLLMFSKIFYQHHTYKLSSWRAMFTLWRQNVLWSNKHRETGGLHTSSKHLSSTEKLAFSVLVKTDRSSLIILCFNFSVVKRKVTRLSVSDLNTKMAMMINQRLKDNQVISIIVILIFLEWNGYNSFLSFGEVVSELDFLVVVVRQRHSAYFFWSKLADNCGQKLTGNVHSRRNFLGWR